jgi:hypothetical protein
MSQNHRRTSPAIDPTKKSSLFEVPISRHPLLASICNRGFQMLLATKLADERMRHSAQTSDLPVAISRPFGMSQNTSNSFFPVSAGSRQPVIGIGAAREKKRVFPVAGADLTTDFLAVPNGFIRFDPVKSIGEIVMGVIIAKYNKWRELIAIAHRSRVFRDLFCRGPIFSLLDRWINNDRGERNAAYFELPVRPLFWSHAQNSPI